jgi:hypothetical protein
MVLATRLSRGRAHGTHHVLPCRLAGNHHRRGSRSPLLAAADSSPFQCSLERLPLVKPARGEGTHMRSDQREQNSRSGTAHTQPSRSLERARLPRGWSWRCRAAGAHQSCASAASAGRKASMHGPSEQASVANEQAITHETRRVAGMLCRSLEHVPRSALSPATVHRVALPGASTLVPAASPAEPASASSPNASSCPSSHLDPSLRLYEGQRGGELVTSGDVPQARGVGAVGAHRSRGRHVVDAAPDVTGFHPGGTCEEHLAVAHATSRSARQRRESCRQIARWAGCSGAGKRASGEESHRVPRHTRVHCRRAQRRRAGPCSG